MPPVTGGLVQSGCFPCSYPSEQGRHQFLFELLRGDTDLLAVLACCQLDHGTHLFRVREIKSELGLGLLEQLPGVVHDFKELSRLCRDSIRWLPSFLLCPDLSPFALSLRDGPPQGIFPVGELLEVHETVSFHFSDFVPLISWEP